MSNAAYQKSLRSDQVAIALVAAMLVALEIVWTRIFSAEFFYSFAFLTVSLAVLGLGLGALLLRFYPALVESPRIGVVAQVASVVAALGPLVILRLDIEFAMVWRSGGDLALLALGVGVLVLPYLAGGAYVAALLRRHRKYASRLYAADLLARGGIRWIGSGLGDEWLRRSCCCCALLYAGCFGWMGARSLPAFGGGRSAGGTGGICLSGG